MEFIDNRVDVFFEGRLSRECVKVPGVPKKRFGIPKKDVDKVVRRGLRLRFAPVERSESLRAWRYLTSGLMSFREERFSLFFGF